MTHEASAQETIRQLKNDLNVHKLALAQLESTKYQLETEGHRLRRLCDDVVKQGEALKDLVKVKDFNRVCFLIVQQQKG
jgi:hypothetical protein